ncbi:MAG: large-conductance mechanosensitive channel protein MscL [Clostridiaceae bacterium]|jgi:large conductance mechanosensitive channel|nr:large-conductance mechanosensitive channel protein MscL [Bacillota bacterium]NLN52290.1 large-conductance mechanosensitive channel protein MscL [Clostridiaceae bacterium]
MWKEFKEFIAQGNVMDLAIGVVMGTAFKAIIDSLVGDIIMPLIGLLLGDVSLSDMKHVFKPAIVEGGEVVKPELSLNYGNLIQMIINFLIIALCIFLVVKGINKLRTMFKKEAEEAEAEEEEKKAEDLILLEEIRDLLAEKAQTNSGNNG